MNAAASQLSYRADKNVFVVEGVLDESSSPVLDRLAGSVGKEPTVVFEVGGVKRINSLGVRAWIDFMKKLGSRTILFRRCSPAFVDQLNTVSDFRGQAGVESFVAPFVCESSGKVFYEELTIGKDVKKDDFSALTGRRCAECPEPLVFDDLPERYLHFLSFL